MQRKPRNDHECEEDVERHTNQIEWKAEVAYSDDRRSRVQEVIDECNAHRYTGNVSREGPCCLVKTRMHTQRSEIHQAREGNDPTILGINNVATINLEEHPRVSTRKKELTWE